MNKLKGKARKLSQTRSASLDSDRNKPKHGKTDHDQKLIKQSISCDLLTPEAINTLMTNYSEPSLDDLKVLASSLKEMKPIKTKDNGESLAMGDISRDSTDTSEHTDMETEANQNENPTIMSVTTVQQMFSSLQAQMNTITDQMKKMQEGHDSLVTEKVVARCEEKVLQKVNEQIVNDDRSVVKLEQDLKYYKRKTHTLTDVVQRMSVEMDDMRARLENVEISSSRKAVSVVGLPIKGQKHEMIESLEHFLYENLGVEVYIEDLYKIGNKEPNVIIAYFQSMYDKRQVMKYKYMLKNFRTRQGNKVFINTYTPMIQQERKKVDAKIHTENKQRATPLEIKYTKGALMIQGETYKPKIATPTPKDLVDLKPEELEEILKLPLHTSTSAKIVQDKSIFEGYTAAVSSYQQIRKLYIKMKLIQPAARHIVCAYYLPGEDTHYTQGFCDDGEPAAGRTAMNLLLENHMVNRVVFISRKYGGIRMGSDRFECYASAARNVLKDNPKNEVLKMDQMVKPKEKNK